ncbi:MAG: tRNA (guanosine(37)-N1)-methyltransferase TrmD [Candidatus Kerfeldbacteria bacterium]|nr:tRNA (guanosine(37)-N1)-methyltransferase TrmD [Candidatus Kerfeldbacteria bacterium]
MRFDILTIFPDAFTSYLGVSIVARAIKKKKVTIHRHDIRDHATDRHRTVDDRPYGGGVGMVMKVEPIVKALNAVPKKRKRVIVLFSAKGKPFSQADARRYAKLDQLILISPRYEGVDERVLDYVDEEVSIGLYVLTGGELPALVVIDAATRLLPGVLGKDESSVDESHASPGVLEYPHYTRPEVFRGKKVPPVLLSGDHKKIREWRVKKRRTRR